MNIREGVSKALARLVADADDAQLERWFGSRVAQRTLFAATPLVFDGDAAAGFEGAIVYELATAKGTAVWTVEVAAGHARARRGAPATPTLTLRLRLADFMRIAAGTLDPVRSVLDGRAEIEGDLEVAVRLPEMFGMG